MQRSALDIVVCWAMGGLSHSLPRHVPYPWGRVRWQETKLGPTWPLSWEALLPPSFMTCGGLLPSHPPCKKEPALQWGPPPVYLSASPAVVSFISTKQLLFVHLQHFPNLWTCFYRPERSQGSQDRTEVRNSRVDLMSTHSPLSASPSFFTKSAHFYCNAHTTDVAFVV